jgi:hypothetical protein
VIVHVVAHYKHLEVLFFLIPRVVHLPTEILTFLLSIGAVSEVIPVFTCTYDTYIPNKTLKKE